MSDNPHTAGRYAIITALITGLCTIVAILVSHFLNKEENNNFNANSVEKNITQKTILIGSQNYKIVKSNGLIWMAENLNYQIPDSWCYQNDPHHCETYGRLYTWEVAKKVCAELGWRLPTSQEFKQLAFSYGGYVDVDSVISIEETTSSFKIKHIGDNQEKALVDLVVGGSSGFNAQLGGLRNPTGEFDELLEEGYYWTSSAYDSNKSWAFEFEVWAESINNTIEFNSSGLSCRCVKEY